jgi:hypothetical protein
VDKVGFTLSDMLLLIGNGIGQFRLQRKITMFFERTANLLRLIPDSEVDARFFAIAQNDNYLFVILNGAEAQ